PVTGGNVSFYNESPDSAVYPTPVIGMVGLIEDISHITTANFKQEGHYIFLIGETKADIGGSEFLKEYYGKVTGDCPMLDLEAEKKVQGAVLKAIRSGRVNSAHDISDGGLAVALAECCIAERENPIGATITLEAGDLRPEWMLFSESQSRFLLSVKPEYEEHIRKLFDELSVNAQHIGITGGDSLKINDWIDIKLKTLRDIYFDTIEKIFKV
ncbi:MAG: AIR synthase-related protein, partial [Calditrichia bacterium]